MRLIESGQGIDPVIAMKIAILNEISNRPGLIYVLFDKDLLSFQF